MAKLEIRSGRARGAESVRRQLKRLRLKEGDIIVVRDHLTLEALMSIAGKVKGMPNCPIVVAEGSIHRLGKEYLADLIGRSQRP